MELVAPQEHQLVLVASKGCLVALGYPAGPCLKTNVGICFSCHAQVPKTPLQYHDFAKEL
jgi:hypothetical protein